MNNQPQNEIPKNSLENLLKDGTISQATYDKVISAQKYIERKYKMMKLKYVENNILQEKLKSSNLPESKCLEIIEEIQQKELSIINKKLEKMSVNNYESLGIIGRGSFGEVHVCRVKKTGEIVAIKKIKKDMVLEKKQVKHILDEQDFLSKVNSQWIVELKASFQEGDYLYLVMEYLPGGDLMGLLIEKDILTEEEARFYICEIILAIDSIHELKCIHRDVKPDNILIGKDGHIKFIDFGLAKISDNCFKEDIIDYKIDESNNRHIRNFSCVGTAFYAAPEVINKEEYGDDIDWWSLGVILFEMIAGYSPFFSKVDADVYHKVKHFQKYLKFPSKCKASDICKDLIIKLVSNPEKRLGKNGSSEIKAHPFFKGINWLKIREMKPPFIPELKNDYDTKYFEHFIYNEPFIPPKDKVVRKRADLEYTSYTFRGKENDPKDILSVISLIQKKKMEMSKSERTNINEIKMNTKEESQENNKTLDTSNNIKDLDKKKVIKPYFTKKEINIYDTNSRNKKNLTIKFNTTNNIENTLNKNGNYTVFQANINFNEMPNNPFENRIIKITHTNKTPKKISIFQNMSNSIKKVFNKTLKKKNK
jgi:serine/threonine kinase 38